MRKLLKLLSSRLVLLAVLIVLQFLLLYSWVTRIAAFYELQWLSELFGLVTAVYIINKNEDSYYKLAWCIAVLAFPILGGFLYILCAGRKMPKKLAHGTTQANSSMKYLLSQSDDVLEILDSKQRVNRLFQYALRVSQFPIYTNTKSTYFESGEKLLPSLLEQLKRAEKFIFMEYFIIEVGSVWDEILEVLKEKAAAGVEVKLIYDDFGCIEKLPHKYDHYLKSLGIEVMRFNPLRPALVIQMNNRDHRKICVIDNQVAFTGGINLADEYMNRIERFGYWRDSAIMIEGEAVWSFTEMFLGMWSYLVDDHENIEYAKYRIPTTISADGGLYQPFSDTPTDADDVSLSVHLNMAYYAKRYLYIETPYLIINGDMQMALCLAARSGVDVRILVPGIPDKRVAYSITRSNYEALLKAGVKIYEFTPGFNHGKNIICDDDMALVGTVNMDYRSYFLHFEDAILFHDAPCIQEMKTSYLTALSRSRMVTLEDCKSTNIIVRMARSIIKIFAPLF